MNTWREAVAAAMASGAVPPPAPPQPAQFTMPTPSELTEASYAFTSKLLADQSRFLEALSKVTGVPDKQS